MTIWYPFPMTLGCRRGAGWILLLCLALLSTRMLGDHLHLCFDGLEPAVTLHGDDGGRHHTSVDVTPAHDDSDVDLLTATSVKRLSTDLLLGSVLLVALFAALQPQAQLRRLFPELSLPSLSSIRHLRPPLRGPPR
ncbi:MAG: hypothetical protein ABI645_00955 [Pseudomonadota bacterium]